MILERFNQKLMDWLISPTQKRPIIPWTTSLHLIENLGFSTRLWTYTRMDIYAILFPKS
jgi:hypothetical protein